jgi:hypothetical protein
LTTPKVSTIKRGGSRFYVNPETGTKAPGVTSILDMLPKPFLRYWAAKEVATTAVDELGTIVTMTLRDREAAIDHLKRAPDRDTYRAATVGGAAHDIFERLAKGEPAGRIPPDVEPFVRHFGEFIDEFSPEYLFMEETVWSETHDYAGSFDALAIIDGDLTWIDYKTTRSGVHEEVALQLAAYSHADYILRPDGTRVPLPHAEAGACVWIRPEEWGVYPVRIDDEVFDDFLALRKVFDYDRERKATVIGDPVGGLRGPSPSRRTPAPRKGRAA